MCTGSGELREGICMYTERLRKQVRKRLRIIICCVERCSRCAIGCMLVIVRGIELGYMHTELLAEIEDKPRLESRLEIKLRGRQLHLVLSAYIRSEYLNDSDRLSRSSLGLNLIEHMGWLYLGEAISATVNGSGLPSTIYGVVESSLNLERQRSDYGRRLPKYFCELYRVSGNST
jgi:hypothetical protein